MKQVGCVWVIVGEQSVDCHNPRCVMGRVVDPKRWDKGWHFPPWLGVMLLLVIAALVVIASVSQRVFSGQ